MFSEIEARRFAQGWISGWNSRDLESIMSHYAQDVVLTSPVAAEALEDPSGTVRGKEAVRRYFQQGLDANPHLTFEFLDIMRGLSSVVLYFRNHKGSKTAEFMEFDASGKVTRVVANYT